MPRKPNTKTDLRAPKKSTKAEPFDLMSLRGAKRYVWREIEREDDAPLRVKLLDLNIRESKEISFGMRTPLEDAYKASAPFVVEWDFRAENQNTGDMIDVPPPAEIGWEAFELLDQSTASLVVSWLKAPAAMQLNDEKKPRPRPGVRTRRPTAARRQDHRPAVVPSRAGALPAHGYFRNAAKPLLGAKHRRLRDGNDGSERLP